jgi:hypothetical protein
VRRLQENRSHRVLGVGPEPERDSGTNSVNFVQDGTYANGTYHITKEAVAALTAPPQATTVPAERVC